MQFYPFGHSENDGTLQVSNSANVDSEAMNLTVNFTFYNEERSQVYVRVCVQIYACYCKYTVSYMQDSKLLDEC